MSVARRIAKSALVGSLSVILVLGAMNLTAPSAKAFPFPPVPLCGPSILWVCTGPGGPAVLFGGTICEKAKFEKKTGLTCVPFGG